MLDIEPHANEDKLVRSGKGDLPARSMMTRFDRAGVDEPARCDLVVVFLTMKSRCD